MAMPVQPVVTRFVNWAYSLEPDDQDISFTIEFRGPQGRQQGHAMLDTVARIPRTPEAQKELDKILRKWKTDRERGPDAAADDPDLAPVTE